MRGRIEKVTTKSVVGFALVPDESKSHAEIDVYMDEIYDHTLVANAYHKVAHKTGLHESGRCGFRVDLKNKDISAVDSLRLFIKGTTFELNNSPVYLSERKSLILHVPKTGGTSLRSMLYDILSPTEVYPSRLELKVLQGGRYLSAKRCRQQIERLGGHKKYIIGHLNKNFANTFLLQPRLFATARDPVERVSSHLLHIQRHDEAFKKATLCEIFERFFDIGRPLQNLQAKSILGSQYADQSNWKKTLEDYDWISTDPSKGLSVLVEKMTGQSIRAPQKNRSPILRAKLSKTLRKRIQQTHQLDIELYKLLRKRWGL